MACSRLQAFVALLVAAAVTSQLAAVEPIRLTHDGRMKFTPVFINGGEDLVFVEIQDPRMSRLQRLQSSWRRDRVSVVIVTRQFRRTAPWCSFPLPREAGRTSSRWISRERTARP
jgi:hypothetical protein